MTDHNTSELARVNLALVRNAVAITHTENALRATQDGTRRIVDYTKPMRTSIDRRLRRADRFAEAVWWIVYFACLGVLIYGFLA